MKLVLESTVAADRERVFAALVNPAILQRCIPGCESLTATGDDSYAATLKIGVAGLKGTYTGKAAITNRQAPDSMTISFDGKGGPGFVRGGAALAFTADGPGGDNTRVACDADVQVGGLIAAVGSRLVEAAARKLADDFFRQLARELEAPA
ncbi:MAG TPA: carbon monoxide dehydrogenase subunit G, partial [Vicinamibacterales bacterium]|nr:carbon monoxide dehydrogenase subunit G [Vicinamibacterales bacterium]